MIYKMAFQKTNLEFAENLIKGKAAEIIFQRMFVEMGTAMIIPYGYENVTPTLAQYYKDMDVHDKEVFKRWPGAYIFLATQEGFFFGRCERIVEEDGAIEPLSTEWVNTNKQKEYLDLLCKYIRI